MKANSWTAAVVLILGALVLATSSAPAQEPGAAGFADALASGEAAIAFRYRYEFVDDDNFGENANASTLRLRLNYETGTWSRWSGIVEFDYTFELLLKDFNSGAGTSGADRDVYPVVADPEGPDLNQVFLQFAPDEDWRIRLGRQRILLDDERFVGGVGWRQNEQTYDGLSLRYDGWERTSVFYSYVANVATIFGSSVPAGSNEQNTHLLNANIELSRDWRVIGYAYLIDNDDVPSFSTNTFGIRAEGAVPVGGGRLALLGEAASQSDAGNAPADFDADYLRAQVLWQDDSLSAGIGFESLGSDNGQGFRTPLATLHAFNGWADRFLSTPSAGLDDFYLRAGFDAGAWKLLGVWHDFRAETGNTDFGRELDFSASRSFGELFGVLVKLAVFDGDALEDDTKFWLMVTAQF